MSIRNIILWLLILSVNSVLLPSLIFSFGISAPLLIACFWLSFDWLLSRKNFSCFWPSKLFAMVTILLEVLFFALFLAREGSLRITELLSFSYTYLLSVSLLTLLTEGILLDKRFSRSMKNP